MTSVVVLLLLVLAAASVVLLVGLATSRHPAPPAKGDPAETPPAAPPGPGPRAPARALPRPPPLSEDSLSLREIDRSFSPPGRCRFESRPGGPGRLC